MVQSESGDAGKNRRDNEAGKRLAGTPDPMHRWLSADGVMIAGDSWGYPEEHPVLLLHGGGQTRHSWKETGVRLAARGFHVISYDARGHGDSDWADDLTQYSMDHMIEDLCAVAGSLNGKPPILVGASMGGICSLLAVGEQRLLSSALVLVDVAPNIEQTGRDEVFAFMKSGLEGFDTLEAVAEAIANYQPHRSRRNQTDSLQKNIRLHTDCRYRWHWDPQWFLSAQKMPESSERRVKSAQALGLPTLLVRGENSNVLSEDGAKAFLQQCPQAEFVGIKNAAHMVTGDKNDIFCDAILEFLSRLSPATQHAKN